MNIRELKIYSSKLQEQYDFYTNILRLNAVEKSDSQISLQIGKSILTIEQKEYSTPYHFALNIPSNKAPEALGWIKSRVNVLKEGKNEIHNFDFWNAEAIYFYDRDFNIVELISRKNLDVISNEKFDSDSLLEISEIGLPTIDIKKVYQKLKIINGLKIYSGGFDRFCAVGDEHGLIICVNINVKDTWFPTSDKIYYSNFKADVTLGQLEYRIEHENENLRILKKNDGN